jgi:hypothetical protein
MYVLSKFGWYEKNSTVAVTLEKKSLEQKDKNFSSVIF